jgi:hypothetical protein
MGRRSPSGRWAHVACRDANVLLCREECVSVRSRQVSGGRRGGFLPGHRVGQALQHRWVTPAAVSRFGLTPGWADVATGCGHRPIMGEQCVCLGGEAKRGRQGRPRS